MKDIPDVPPRPEGKLNPDILSIDEGRQLDMAIIIYHLLLDQPSGHLPALSVVSLEKFCTILLNPKFGTHGQVNISLHSFSTFSYFASSQLIRVPS